MDDLVHLVAELKEEVERLRAIRECEREIEWWGNSLRGLKERYWGETPQMGVDPLPCCSHAEAGNLGVEEEWRQVPARHRRQCHPIQAPPSQVPFHNRLEALELERPVAEKEVESVARRMPWVESKPQDCYPLLIVQAGSDDIEERSLKAVKRDVRGLGKLVDGAGVQVEQISTLQPMEEPPVQEVEGAWRRLQPMESPHRSRPQARPTAHEEDPTKDQEVWRRVVMHARPRLEQFAPDRCTSY